MNANRLLLLSLVSVAAISVAGVGTIVVHKDPVPQTRTFWQLGDSKTTPSDWPGIMSNALNEVDFNNWVADPPRAAAAGYSMRHYAVASNSPPTIIPIDTILSGYTASAPSHVLINLGANEVNGDVLDIYSDAAAGTDTNSAHWKTNAAYVVDQIHAKWPDAIVHMIRPWKTGEVYQAKLDALNTNLIPFIISTRTSWMRLGPSEYIILRGASNWVDFMPDGLHPNATGREETAYYWRTNILY